MGNIVAGSILFVVLCSFFCFTLRFTNIYCLMHIHKRTDQQKQKQKQQQQQKDIEKQLSISSDSDSSSRYIYKTVSTDEYDTIDIYY